MNYRNTVGARLMFAFAGVIIVFAAAVTLSIARLAAFDASMNEITGPELAKAQIAGEWLDSLSESMRHTRNMLIMDDKAQIQGEIAKVHDLSEKRVMYAETMTSMVESAEDQALVKAALDAHETLKPLDEEYLRQIEAGDVKAAKDTLLQRSRPSQLAVIAALKNLGDHQQAKIHAKAEELAVSYRSTRALLITLSLAAVAVACLLAWLLTRAIKNPLNHAVAVLGEIEKGNYASVVTVSSKDEIGQTLRGLERMQVALRERTEKEHASAMENARIRTALDRVSVGTMLGDTDGKIIYMNDALRALFRSQLAEMRKQIPSFDPEQLVGSSFDVFHQIPSLQRNALAGLTSAHTVDVKVGGASLRIVANPVADGAGKRVGTAVQWVDRTQEVATEEEVQAIVAKAIDGDLTARIREEDKEAFFKTLASGVNRVLMNMADVVRSMAGAAAEVRTGSEEISRGNADLSQRTEEQASSLEETASSMEEMTSTVKNNADNAAQANQLAAAAREQAERGGSVVGAAVAAMGEINASSKRIADIISVIDEIAFQTNLLALNAAVEAARAGEQGRGFAVVASEVRNLASRSAEAAKEIKTLIQDSVGKVTEGTRLVDESGKALGEIVVRVKKVTDVMAEIASSSREQASGIEQVNKAITMMDDVTQQNAALVEEASAAAQALTEQASNLTQLISRYRVGESSAAEAPRAAARPPAAPAVERRAPTRPMTGKKRPVAVSTPAPARAGGAAAEEWKDF
ncbi:MAG TPA: methyl-accepting chemotaxis protein [Steroidobacteraceae bacterium]